MKVLFDHQTFSLQRYGGISRYFANLHKGINSVPRNSSRIAALYSDNEYVKEEHFLLSNALGEGLFAGKKKRCYAWNRRYSRWNVRLGNYDVFHPTYYDPYFIKYSDKPYVVTVHDMVHELYPHYISDSAEVILRKKKVITQASAIIAISNHTRQDIIKVYPELESKISVVHHGYIWDTSQEKSNIELPSDYLLFVGERWHYKNFTMFIKSIAPLLKDNRALQLICAGGGNFNPDEEQLLAGAGIAQQCRQMDVTDTVLKQLYAQAIAFVFPSLQEGFGLPVLEAFAQGCPVICSNITALPEVAGDAAIYFDPNNSVSITEAVRCVLHDPALQNGLKNKGRQRLGLFTFEACVQKTLNVYQTLL